MDEWSHPLALKSTFCVQTPPGAYASVVRHATESELRKLVVHLERNPEVLERVRLRRICSREYASSVDEALVEARPWWSRLWSIVASVAPAPPMSAERCARNAVEEFSVEALDVFHYSLGEKITAASLLSDQPNAPTAVPVARLQQRESSRRDRRCRAPPTRAHITPRVSSLQVPTIAVVPPTPDAVKTPVKTTVSPDAVSEAVASPVKIKASSNVVVLETVAPDNSKEDNGKLDDSGYESVEDDEDGSENNSHINKNNCQSPPTSAPPTTIATATPSSLPLPLAATSFSPASVGGRTNMSWSPRSAMSVSPLALATETPSRPSFSTTCIIPGDTSKDELNTTLIASSDCAPAQTELHYHRFLSPPTCAPPPPPPPPPPPSQMVESDFTLAYPINVSAFHPSSFDFPPPPPPPPHASATPSLSIVSPMSVRMSTTVRPTATADLDSRRSITSVHTYDMPTPPPLPLPVAFATTTTATPPENTRRRLFEQLQDSCPLRRLKKLTPSAKRKRRALDDDDDTAFLNPIQNALMKKFRNAHYESFESPQSQASHNDSWF